MSAGVTASAETIVLRDDINHIPLPKLDYLETSATDSVQSIAAPEFAGAWSISEGVVPTDDNYYDTKIHWFRIEVKKSERSESMWWLVVDWPLIDYLRLHVFDHKTQSWRSDEPIGARFPKENEAVINRNYVLPLSLAKGDEATVFVEIRSAGVLIAPFSIWRRDAYIVANQLNLILIGTVLGAVAAMMLYNFGIFTVLRDKSYLYYSIYGASILFYMFCSLGVGALYLWGQVAWMNERAYPISATLSFFTAMLFSYEFLSIRNYGKFLNRLYLVLIASWAAATALNAFANLFVVSYFIAPIQLVTLIVGFAAPIYLWRKGNDQAKFFMLAWSLVLIGTTVLSLSMVGVIAFTPLVYYTHIFSFFLELVLLAYALAHRINQERRQRLEAQAETMRMQEQLNSELETHVKKRTEQLRLTLDQLELANEELTKLSVTDPITKIHNRRYFDRAIVEECRRAYREQQSLAILLLDIDNFKKINDNFGHAIGDECLRVIAKTLSAQIKRSGDLVARFGGEEFVAILPNTDDKDAELFAEQCRHQISEIEFECNGVKVKLTTSVGVAAAVPQAENGYRFLIEEADRALYRGKSLGRNRVVVARELLKPKNVEHLNAK